MILSTAPDVSIALTTYNRPELLRSCVKSILDQSFSNFEILIGNDYVDAPVTSETLGLVDARIVIFNHTSSLGEINNINFLLRSSRGRYFTCIADDDCLFPGFLETTRSTMNDISNPSVVFTNYSSGPTFPGTVLLSSSKLESCMGQGILTSYVTRQIHLIGTGGLFKRDFLIALGGVPHLGGFSPYSDVFLAMKCSILDRVAYVPEPLYFFRQHDNSISFMSTDAAAYLTAQKTMIAGLLPMIKKSLTSIEQLEILTALITWFASDYRRVLLRSERDKLQGRGVLLIPHMFRNMSPGALIANPLLIFNIASIDIRHLIRWVEMDLSAQVLPKLRRRPKDPATNQPYILPRWLCK